MALHVLLTFKVRGFYLHIVDRLLARGCGLVPKYKQIAGIQLAFYQVLRAPLPQAVVIVASLCRRRSRARLYDQPLVGKDGWSLHVLEVLYVCRPALFLQRTLVRVRSIERGLAIDRVVLSDGFENHAILRQLLFIQLANISTIITLLRSCRSEP